MRRWLLLTLLFSCSIPGAQADKPAARMVHFSAAEAHKHGLPPLGLQFKMPDRVTLGAFRESGEYVSRTDSDPPGGYRTFVIYAAPGLDDTAAALREHVESKIVPLLQTGRTHYPVQWAEPWTHEIGGKPRHAVSFFVGQSHAREEFAAFHLPEVASGEGGGVLLIGAGPAIGVFRPKELMHGFAPALESMQLR